jgi:hypothetical protein
MDLLQDVASCLETLGQTFFYHRPIDFVILQPII